jgi:hypothetical protein
MEHVGVKDAPFLGVDSFASESGCLQHTESYKLRFEQLERFQHHRPNHSDDNARYALPSGGIRSLTLGLKPVF